jgi:hypothetical protein
MTSSISVLALAFAYLLLLTASLAERDAPKNDIDAALREEALAKLARPLKDMSVKELKSILSERGMPCWPHALWVAQTSLSCSTG